MQAVLGKYHNLQAVLEELSNWAEFRGFQSNSGTGEETMPTHPRPHTHTPDPNLLLTTETIRLILWPQILHLAGILYLSIDRNLCLPLKQSQQKMASSGQSLI